MSFTDSSQPHNFQTIEDELKYWKTSYLNLYEDYKQLLSCHTCKTAVPEDLQPPPPKKRKIEEVQLDPIEFLPEPCAVEILKFLTVPELKLAMEVSKGWRDFINGQSSLMGKMKFNTWDEEEYRLRWRIFDIEKKNKRSYKHLKTSFDFNTPFCYNNPVSLYASTLETLELDLDLAERYECCKSLHETIFPNLRYLVLPQCFKFYRFWKCRFPALTHLKITFYEEWGYSLDCVKLLEMIQLMPKLEKLMLCTPGIESNYSTNDIEEDNMTDDNDMTDDTYKPAIRSIITCADFPINFFKKLQSSSLTEMKIRSSSDFSSYYSSQNLTQFLRDFKTLKCLTIKYLYITDIISGNRDEINLEPNESIEVFKVEQVDYDEKYENEESVVDGRLEVLLRALPSLKELVLFDYVTPRILKFIAGNMRQLKKLICKEISPELLRAYHKIQIYRHLYVNTSFEFIADPSYEAIIEREFDFNF